jgi:hypothetical protein
MQAYILQLVALRVLRTALERISSKLDMYIRYGLGDKGVGDRNGFDVVGDKVGV